jgi:hypothetical protein
VMGMNWSRGIQNLDRASVVPSSVRRCLSNCYNSGDRVALTVMKFGFHKTIVTLGEVTA